MGSSTRYVLSKGSKHIVLTKCSDATVVVELINGRYIHDVIRTDRKGGVIVYRQAKKEGYKRIK